MKKISVAVDFSDVTSRVLEKAVESAKPHGATIYLVHVMEDIPAAGMYGFTPEEIPMVGPNNVEVKMAVDDQMLSIVADLKKKGVNVEAVVLEGDPLDELLSFNEEKGMDMTMVGTHGHGVLAGLLLGSVAEGAARRSKIPVLIVPYGE